MAAFCPQPAARVEQGAEKRAAGRFAQICRVAGDLDKDQAAGAWLDVELEHGAMLVQHLGRRVEAKAGAAALAVQSDIGQGDSVRLEGRRLLLTPMVAVHAAGLEQVAEIGGKQQLDADVLWRIGEAADRQPLVARAVPKEARAADVEQIVLQHQPALLVEVRVGEIAGELGIVVAQGGTQQHRPLAPDQQTELAEMPGVAKIHPVAAAGPAEHVAAGVEHAERVSALERKRAPFLQRDGGGNVEGIRLGGLRGHALLLVDRRRVGPPWRDAQGRETAR